jgi:PII-like signaling protein
MKMLKLTIRVKKNDDYYGRRLYKSLLELLIQNKVSGVTVWTGIDGFGKRRHSTIQLEGITINKPLIIEVVDEESKLASLLSQLKRMIGDNGLTTVEEVDAI